MTEQPAPYPVRVDATQEQTTRWLWLVKWLLVLPHAVVLAFLWLAFTVLTVVAFFAVLVTGRYPRAVFDFNVGVLRWTWRVQYYAYSALGTDRYPPFTLAEVPGYPAHLSVEYPERLSRGLVLVKWWLLAIPHYVVVAVFAGGGLWLTSRAGDDGWGGNWGSGGLIGLLVLVAAVVLLFTGRYPRPLFDFVLGMDRWVLRVAAYAALMTDRYPPFRLDMGGTDPGSVPAGPLPPAPTGTGTAAPVPAGGATATTTAPAGPGGRPRGWTAGRVVALVAGALLVLVSTAPLAAGTGLLVADATHREGDWLVSPASTVSTGRYALVSDRVVLETAGADWVLDDLVGRVRVQATPTDGSTPLFVGIAPSAEADRWLAGVGQRMVTGDRMWDGWTSGMGRMTTDLAGGPPSSAPTQASIWAAQTSGPGAQRLTWTPRDGDWTVVVMRADGAAGVSADVRLAATVPALRAVSIGLLAGGALLLVVGGLLVALAVQRAHVPPGPPTAPDGAGTAPRIPGPAAAPTAETAPERATQEQAAQGR
ncbi:DUF4389 domain-containing protein [Modestobacter sp. NPDC049651]|uniref:DUF4389 domain-containing protein n=1 Tax=unclassified Modestobacter TaxID=2643866 RepID=UPI0034043BDA